MCKLNWQHNKCNSGPIGQGKLLSTGPSFSQSGFGPYLLLSPEISSRPLRWQCVDSASICAIWGCSVLLADEWYESRSAPDVRGALQSLSCSCFRKDASVLYDNCFGVRLFMKIHHIYWLDITYWKDQHEFCFVVVIYPIKHDE